MMEHGDAKKGAHDSGNRWVFGKHLIETTNGSQEEDYTTHDSCG